MVVSKRCVDMRVSHAKRWSTISPDKMHTLYTNRLEFGFRVDNVNYNTGCLPDGDRQTYSKGIADLFQIDLADLSNLSTYNDRYRYLLNCIDVFTKRAWSIPLRTKTGREVSDAFERILAEQRCNVVQSDKGAEFLNSTFQSTLRRH